MAGAGGRALSTQTALPARRPPADALTLGIIEGLIEATYQKAPWDTLHRVNVLLEKQRVRCRLAYNLRHLDVRRYEFAAKKLG